MMRAIIVEDEHIASNRLRRMLVEIKPEIEVITVLESIGETAEYLTSHNQPDLLFLDIHLADGNSFELFNLVQIESAIIFTTAYDQYALQAFRAHAVDYLLKPIKPLELQEAIQKVVRKEPSESSLKSLLDNYNQSRNKRFLTRLGTKLHIIEHDQIAYCFTRDKMSFIVQLDGSRFPINKTLDQIEEMVNPEQFFRANRQVILSIGAIDEMIAYSKSRLKIMLQPKTDFDIIISTEKTPLFKQWIEG